MPSPPEECVYGIPHFINFLQHFPLYGSLFIGRGFETQTENGVKGTFSDEKIYRIYFCAARNLHFYFFLQ